MNEEIRTYLDKRIKTEAHLEEVFSREVKKAGGWSIKFNSIGTNGLPDRIVFYKCFTWLVELKTPKGTIQPIQKNIHKKFSDHGFKVRIVRSREDILAFVEDMLNIVL